MLAEAWREARDPGDLEHVTPFIYNQPERYRLGCVTQEQDLSALRWTLDTPEDYAMIGAVYDALHFGNPAFATEGILAFLCKKPDAWVLNATEEARVVYQGLAAPRPRETG